MSFMFRNGWLCQFLDRNCGLDKLMPRTKHRRCAGTQENGKDSLGMEHAHDVGPYPASRVSPEAPRDGSDFRVT